MLNAIKNLPKLFGARGPASQGLQAINAILYSAYLDDRAPVSIANSNILHNAAGLAIYAGRVEDFPGAVPENWRFRLKDIQSRSRRLSRLFRTGSDVSDLPLDGFERIWRDDLLMMMERRRPVISSLFIPIDRSVIETEHLVLPFFRHGRIVSFIGAFAADEITLHAIRRSKKLKLSAVRRAVRPQTLPLPRARRVEGAGAEAGKFRRAISAAIEAGERSDPDRAQASSMTAEDSSARREPARARRSKAA